MATTSAQRDTFEVLLDASELCELQKVGLLYRSGSRTDLPVKRFDRQLG